MSVLKIKDGNTWIPMPASGVGVPLGGTQGQVLMKASSTDYDAGWATPKTLGVDSLSHPYSIAANGSYATNLKTLIDADKPSGSTVLGIVGYATNDVNVIAVALKYQSTNYSLQLRNLSNATNSHSIDIFYLYEI